MCSLDLTPLLESDSSDLTTVYMLLVWVVTARLASAWAFWTLATSTSFVSLNPRLSCVVIFPMEHSYDFYFEADIITVTSWSWKLCLKARPHPAHVRRRGLVSQAQILGLAPEAWSNKWNPMHGVHPWSMNSRLSYHVPSLHLMYLCV